MAHTTPYHIFKSEVANSVIDAGVFDAEWFSTQEARLSMYWNAGESVDSASEMMVIFSKARADKLYSRGCSFTDKRICLGVERV